MKHKVGVDINNKQKTHAVAVMLNSEGGGKYETNT
jgi:hypothetical protein